MNTRHTRTTSGVCISACDDVQRRNSEARTDQCGAVPDSALHARFEREAIPLLGSLQHGAMRLTNNRQDAEDLVQDAMLLAYSGFGSFREGTNIKAWMFRVMYNAWINRYRKQCRRPPEVLVDYFTDSRMLDQSRVGRSQRSAEVEALERIPDERVWNALLGLREEYRMAVYYVDVEGFRYQDIANVMGAPVRTAMSRLYRGRTLLRKALAEPAAE